MAAAAVTAVLVAFGLTGCGTAREPTRTTEARVELVWGEVHIDGKAAVVGSTIPPTFRVVTGLDSTVAIVFDGKNVLTVEEDTEAYVDLAADLRTVELRRGALASALRKLNQVTTREPDRFRVKTPSAVAGVRGTVFYVKVEDPAHTYLCTCNGTLHLTDGSGANPFTSEAIHHEAFRFAREDDGTVTAGPAEMAWHTDRDMETVAARIGETIDWTIRE